MCPLLCHPEIIVYTLHPFWLYWYASLVELTFSVTISQCPSVIKILFLCTERTTAFRNTFPEFILSLYRIRGRFSVCPVIEFLAPVKTLHTLHSHSLLERSYSLLIKRLILYVLYFQGTQTHVYMISVCTLLVFPTLSIVFGLCRFD